MVRFFFRLKTELKHIFFVFLFFFFAFAILNATEISILRRAGLPAYSLFDVAVAAALIAKVFLVIDHLPFSFIVSRRPLIYLVIWKALLSWVTTFFIRMSVRFFPYLFLEGNLRERLGIFFNTMDWGLFFSLQTWYLMLLFLYIISRELGRVIGIAKVREIFFGKKN